MKHPPISPEKFLTKLFLKKACEIMANVVKERQFFARAKKFSWHRVFALRGLESRSKTQPMFKNSPQQFPSTRERIARPGVLAGRATWLWP
jgi:hypothetical protein